jgi:hypothetical protein
MAKMSKAKLKEDAVVRAIPKKKPKKFDDVKVSNRDNLEVAIPPFVPSFVVKDFPSAESVDTGSAKETAKDTCRGCEKDIKKNRMFATIPTRDGGQIYLCKECFLGLPHWVDSIFS